MGNKSGLRKYIQEIKKDGKVVKQIVKRQGGGFGFSNKKDKK